MVKLKSPLSSSSASGSLADRITFITIGGKPYAKFIGKGPVGISVDQESLRQVFKDASLAAKELTAEEKVYYAGLKPNSAACPWWNNFIGEYIKENWPVSADVNSFTRKREPAVADFQALHSFVREKGNFTIVEAGQKKIDIYTVPEGYVFKQELLTFYCNTGNPSALALILIKNTDEYVYYSEVYGVAWEVHVCVTPVTYDAGEKVRIQVDGCVIDDVLYWYLFGYLTNKY